MLRSDINENGAELHKIDIFKVPDIQKQSNAELLALSNKDRAGYKVLDVSDIAGKTISELSRLIHMSNLDEGIHVIGFPPLETIAAMNMIKLVDLLDEKYCDEAERNSHAQTKKELEKNISEFETGLKKWKTKLNDIQRLKTRIGIHRFGHLQDLQRCYNAEIDGR